MKTVSILFGCVHDDLNLITCSVRPAGVISYQLEQIAVVHRIPDSASLFHGARGYREHFPPSLQSSILCFRTYKAMTCQQQSMQHNRICDYTDRASILSKNNDLRGFSRDAQKIIIYY